MNKELLLVLNPCAGQRRANRFLPDIIRKFNDYGYNCNVYVTAAAGDARDYIRGLDKNYERIVCIGGDGTLNETVCGVTESRLECPVAYIPAGTTNDFAASLGLSADVMTACTDCVEGVPVAFDLGSFNGRYFNYTASCGAFAKASYSTSQTAKNAIGHLAYIMEGIWDLPDIHRIHMKFEAAGKVYEDEYMFCSITNSLSVGGILKLSRDMVSLNDGLFEVMLVRYPKSPIELTRYISAVSNFDIPCDGIEFFTAESVKIHSFEEIEWTLDGERGAEGYDFDAVNLYRRMKLVLPKRALQDIPVCVDDIAENAAAE